MIKYESPAYKKQAFNCPHCGAFAHQQWVVPQIHAGKGWNGVPDTLLAFCQNCYKFSFWYENMLCYPQISMAPLPNEDLPDDIKLDYEEARKIASISPRGAAALLRLVIQKICKYLGENGNNLNSDIAQLVKKGLPATTQKALDYVRVIGNNAVHPGQIDIKDDVETAEQLFKLVNIISDAMISNPKHIKELYESLPEDQKEQIEKRDVT